MNVQSNCTKEGKKANQIETIILSLIPMWALGSLILQLIESTEYSPEFLKNHKKVFRGPLADFFSNQIIQFYESSKFKKIDYEIRIPSYFGIIEHPDVPNDEFLAIEFGR